MQNINLNQVLFEGASTFDAYFRAYNKIDIALDPFPHHGGTTTHDALYMGVPVVTLAGHSYVNRMGVSILTNLGYPQWIAQSKAEYLEIIKKLTEDWNRLNRTRLSLRKKMLNSPLCEARQFAQNFEEKIVSIFRDI